MRKAIFWGRELFALPLLHVALSPMTRRLAMRHLRRQVPDPELRRRVTPDYAPGCKRILLSDDYLPALGRPNVELVSGGVAEVREGSIVGTDGVERPVDTIILGTGFRVTDMPIAERIRDAGGTSLAERWDGSPQAHRGTTVAGYPNLFLLLGPNTGLGHNSVVVMAEAQAGYVEQALQRVEAEGAAAVEVPAGGAGALERLGAGADARNGLDRRRLSELVLRPQGPQHDALAGLQLPLRTRAEPLRAGGASACPRRAG